MIKVLIVDDSSVVREFMTHILSSDPEIKVIGAVDSGEKALEFLKEKKPDMITMDIHMPGIGGLEATRLIMENFPTPVVIVSGTMRIHEMAFAFDLITAGALAVLSRPPGIGDPEFAAARQILIQNLKLMSEIKVIRRFPNQSRTRELKAQLKQPILRKTNGFQLIAIGASTGGPPVLNTILSKLPKDLPVPVLIVQHIAKGFLKGFIDWLEVTSNLPVFVARDNEKMLPGHCYIAPDGMQMGILPGSKLSIKEMPPENGLCPSVDYLFRSVAETIGSGAIGVLLTGMGKDGAKELKNMKNEGAFTIAQDEESCVVFGMPGEAVKIGAADRVLCPDKIVEVLSELCKAKIEN